MSDPEKFEVHNRWISNEERNQFFERASIVVLPYVEATQSGVIPVAYAHAKPVIATQTGSLPDLVDHAKTGLLVPPKDEYALANAMIELLSDAARSSEMGIAGKQKWLVELSPDVIAKKTIAVYRAAIRDHAASRKKMLKKEMRHRASTVEPPGIDTETHRVELRR